MRAPAPTAAPDAGLRATVADLLRRVSALEAQVLRRSSPFDERRFLLAVAASVRGCTFTAGELKAHAAADPELRNVLGRLTTRQIGKRLRALAGRRIAGLTVQRVTRDEQGLVWAVNVSGD